MSFLRYIPIFLIALFATPFVEAALPPASHAILNYIEKNLPQYGTLKISRGFVYLDLDDEYIHKLNRFIQKEGFAEPPYFGFFLVGAHISVMSAKETEKNGIKKVEECGQVISFIPQTCEIVHPHQLKDIDEVYIINVEAPQLERIREKYGLPKHAFHITIGIKYKTSKSA